MFMEDKLDLAFFFVILNVKPTLSVHWHQQNAEESPQKADTQKAWAQLKGMNLKIHMNIHRIFFFPSVFSN